VSRLRIDTRIPRCGFTITIVIIYFMGALIVGCGSKDKSSGVAQLDDTVPVVAPNNSKNLPESEGQDASASDSSSSDEDISERTEEEVVTSFAECLREEGITISDPEINADGTVNMMAFRQSMMSNPDFNFQNPQTRQTLDKCIPLLQNASFAGQRPQEDEIELQDNLLELAHCLRNEGIDVGDPNFSEGGRWAFQSMLRQLNVDQDSVQEAMSQCSELIFGNQGSGGRPPGAGGRPR